MKTKLILMSIFTFIAVTTSNAQLLDLIKSKVKDKAIDLAGNKLSKAISRDAITTNFKDCDSKNILPPTKFATEKFVNLCAKEKTESGYFLKPGFYELKLKSFCLKAGTYGPSKGDGYLYAPVLGPKEKIVKNIIKNWCNHTEIPQSDIQTLLWAIVAKTKFKNMPPQMQATALKLLSDSEVNLITTLGMDFVNQNDIQSVIGEFPRPVQLVLEAENKMRQLFASNSYSYQELESIAVLAGLNTEKPEVLYGTWGLNPKGFYTSYYPNGYAQMVVKIYVPNTIKEVYYLPSDEVAVPSCTSSQRLAISDMTICK